MVKKLHILSFRGCLFIYLLCNLVGIVYSFGSFGVLKSRKNKAMAFFLFVEKRGMELNKRIFKQSDWLLGRRYIHFDWLLGRRYIHFGLLLFNNHV